MQIYSSSRRLDAVKSLLTAPVPYVAPLMVGVAPLLFLHWLYQPIVRANPGLNAYKAPIATLLLPPLRQLESVGLAEKSSEASLADVAADFAQPGLPDEKPKVPQSVKNRHLVVSSHTRRRPLGQLSRAL